MCKIFLGVLIALGFMISSVQAADNYKIDPAHTNVGFSAKHMMVSTVNGSFDKLDGQIIYDPNDLANSKINVTIDVSSINTRNEKRDSHLKSADFFDVGKFSNITFVSKSITASEIVGDLTIKGVTKEVAIPTTIEGPVKTPFGSTVIGINGALSLNRQDFGVNWNKALDQGGVAVSDEVKVSFSVEAVKEEAAAK